MNIFVAMKDKLLFFCGISGILAVIAGASGAHALKFILTPDQLESFNTAVLYHLLHTIVLLGLALSPIKNALFKYASIFFMVGIFIFSGSIYLLALRELISVPWLRFLGPITPLGGMLLIGGWICLTMEGIKKNKIIN
jgi:uncharacterized membrane protein YgdD (TMEM256/DUF423 family)